MASFPRWLGAITDADVMRRHGVLAGRTFCDSLGPRSSGASRVEVEGFEISTGGRLLRTPKCPRRHSWSMVAEVGEPRSSKRRGRKHAFMSCALLQLCDLHQARTMCGLPESRNKHSGNEAFANPLYCLSSRTWGFRPSRLQMFLEGFRVEGECNYCGYLYA